MTTKICVSCNDNAPSDCPESENDCGHHCNHVSVLGACCWCGKVVGKEDKSEDK